MRRRTRDRLRAAENLGIGPTVGKISCISSFSVVVLPAPFGPRKPKTSPVRNVEREPVERAPRPLAPEPDREVLRQLFDLDGGWHVRSAAPPRRTRLRSPAAHFTPACFSSYSIAALKNSGRRPGSFTPLTKKVGVPVTRSCAPERDVALDQLDHRREALLEIRDAADLPRPLPRRRTRHGRLVLEQPLLHLVGPPVLTGEAHGDGRLARTRGAVPAACWRCTPGRAGNPSRTSFTSPGLLTPASARESACIPGTSACRADTCSR